MKKKKEDDNKKNIKCVFCNSILSDITVSEIFRTQGCSSCGYGSEGTAVVTIRCDKCEKVIYRKEFKDF